MEIRRFFEIFISDEDECIRDASLCGASEECINDHGTYSCVCRLGYKRKNTACVKIGERSMTLSAI